MAARRVTHFPATKDTRQVPQSTGSEQNPKIHGLPIDATREFLTTVVDHDASHARHNRARLSGARLGHTGVRCDAPLDTMRHKSTRSSATAARGSRRRTSIEGPSAATTAPSSTKDAQ